MCPPPQGLSYQRADGGDDPTMTLVVSGCPRKSVSGSGSTPGERPHRQGRDPAAVAAMWVLASGASRRNLAAEKHEACVTAIQQNAVKSGDEGYHWRLVTVPPVLGASWR